MPPQTLQNHPNPGTNQNPTTKQQTTTTTLLLLKDPDSMMFIVYIPLKNGGPVKHSISNIALFFLFKG